MKTVAIIEGFSGGPRLTKKFRQSLDQSGFTVIKQRAKADIIFAHSAGIHDLPKNTEAKLIVLVDPPYWPGKKLRKRFVHNLRVGKRHAISTHGRKYFLKKRLHQTYYIIAKNKYLWVGLRGDNKLDFLEYASAVRKILLVRNELDSFCSPEIEKLVKGLEYVEYVELPGHHDDYVTNPRPYIELIKKHLTD